MPQLDGRVLVHHPSYCQVTTHVYIPVDVVVTTGATVGWTCVGTSSFLLSGCSSVIQ